MAPPLRRKLRPLPGLACLHWIDYGAQRAWWTKYAGRLTPDECQRIRGGGAGAGDYHSFQRPYKPTFIAGDWLIVYPGRNLKVRVSAVQPRPGGKYRCVIDQVVDFRSPGPRVTASQRNEWGETEPEPEGVDVNWLTKFAGEAESKRNRLIREAIESAR